MKVIDLIDIKEKPKKIIIDNIKYKLNESSTEFRTLYLDDEEHNWYDFYILALNENVEIIEGKPEKIEKITMCTSGIMGFDGVENITTELKNKINELTKTVNYLLEKSDSNGTL